MHAADRSTRLKMLLAYAVIYFVWGSTFFAIRVGVLQSPPLLFAAGRIFPACVSSFTGLPRS